MKRLLLLLGAMALLVGCSTTDNNMGATGVEWETTGQEFDAAMGNSADALISPINRNSTGVLGVGTGAAGMGAGTGLGAGSTGSGRPY